MSPTATGQVDNLAAHLADAERKAWDSLAHYKFAMFGYWAGIWVHLNQIEGQRRANPFRDLVHLARTRAPLDKISLPAGGPTRQVAASSSMVETFAGEHGGLVLLADAAPWRGLWVKIEYGKRAKTWLVHRKGGRVPILWANLDARDEVHSFATTPEPTL